MHDNRLHNITNLVEDSAAMQKCSEINTVKHTKDLSQEISILGNNPESRHYVKWSSEVCTSKVLRINFRTLHALLRKDSNGYQIALRLSTLSNGYDVIIARIVLSVAQIPVYQC